VCCCRRATSTKLPDAVPGDDAAVAISAGGPARGTRPADADGREGRNDPHRTAATSAPAFLLAGRQRADPLLSAARNATCDRRRPGAGAMPADRSSREISGYVNLLLGHSGPA